jgi:hypothetical protein
MSEKKEVAIDLKKKEVAIDPKDLRESAKKYYVEMQKSWFLFAKTIKAIRDTDTYKAFEFTTFKDFCVREYPSMHYSTIVKTIRVVEELGGVLEGKLKENPDYQLPAYESCYQLITVEDKIPKPDFVKLRKDIIEGKLSYSTLRDRLKEIISKFFKEEKEKIGTAVDDIEEELVKDIESDSDDIVVNAFEEIKDERDSGESVSLEEESDRVILDSVRAKVESLSEALIEMTKDLSSSDVTDAHVEIGEGLEELVKVINIFLKKLEEVSNG